MARLFGQGRHHRSAYDRIVDAYMEHLVDFPTEPASVSRLCRRSGVSRTLFHRHFTSVQDLETRFLQRFLHRSTGPRTVPASLEALGSVNRQLVDLMRSRRRFFSALYRESRLYPLRQQWRRLVETRIQANFDFHHLPGDQRRNWLRWELSMAVIDQYLEVAFWETSEENLDALTRHLVSYLQGGWRLTDGQF